MNKDFDECEKVFQLLLEADRKIWDAVVSIENREDPVLEDYVQQLMEVRGLIHVKFLRPIYKRFPEIATAAGFDDGASDSR